MLTESKAGKDVGCLAEGVAELPEIRWQGWPCSGVTFDLKLGYWGTTHVNIGPEFSRQRELWVQRPRGWAMLAFCLEQQQQKRLCGQSEQETGEIWGARDFGGICRFLLKIWIHPMSKDKPWDGFNQGNRVMFFLFPFHYHSVAVLTRKGELEQKKGELIGGKYSILSETWWRLELEE